jgi:hypothetical protein
MSHKLYFLKDTLASGSNFGALQQDGVAPSSAIMTDTGWGNPTSPDFYSPLIYEEINTGFSTTVLPVAGGPPNNTTGDSFRTPTPLTVKFAAAYWTFNLAGYVSSISGSAVARMRVYRSTSPTGAGATEIIAGSTDNIPITFPQWGLGGQPFAQTFQVTNGGEAVIASADVTGQMTAGDYVIFDTGAGLSSTYQIGEVAGTLVQLNTPFTGPSYATAACTDYGPLAGITQLAGTFTLVHNSTTITTSVSQIGTGVDDGTTLWFGEDFFGVVSAVTATTITLTAGYGGSSMTTPFGCDTGVGAPGNSGVFPTQFNSSVTWAPSTGALSLTNEYLFFQIAIYSTNTTGTHDVLLVQDPANSVIITPGYTTYFTNPIEGESSVTDNIVVKRELRDAFVGTASPAFSFGLQRRLRDSITGTATMGDKLAVIRGFKDTIAGSSTLTDKIIVARALADAFLGQGSITDDQLSVFRSLLVAIEGVATWPIVLGLLRGYSTDIEGVATLSNIPVHVVRGFLAAFIGEVIATFPLADRRLPIQGAATVDFALGVLRHFTLQVEGQGTMTDSLGRLIGLMMDVLGTSTLAEMLGVIRGYDLSVEGTATVDIPLTIIIGFILAVLGYADIAHLQMGVIRVIPSAAYLSEPVSLNVETCAVSIQLLTTVDESSLVSTLPRW